MLCDQIVKEVSPSFNMDKVHLKEIQNSYALIKGEITLQFVFLGLTFYLSEFIVSHGID